VKFVEGGRIDADLMRFISANVRLPQASAGDFRAQLAANAIATTRIRELIERLGPDAFRAYCAALNEYSERRTRTALARLPIGTYAAEDFLDNDGITDDPVRVAVTIR